MSKVKIALPKGRFYDKSIDIIARSLNKNNFDRNKICNKLVFENEDYIFFLLKTSDICELIFNKKIDIGLVPCEWIIEFELQYNIVFEKVKKIDWIKTRISLIGRISDSFKNNDTIATSYPFITKKYLEKNHEINSNLKLKVYKLNGSIEATVPRFFNFGVDCVETGKTISCNSLIELHVIYDNLSLFLIKNKDKKIQLNKINNLFIENE